MALIPLLRSIVYLLATLCAFAVLGLSVRLEVLINGISSTYFSFVPFGIAAGVLTGISLPVFYVLGRNFRRIFTSMIVFEIVWFFLLWIVWVALAGNTVADRAFFFPLGCDSEDPTVNSVCMEITAIEGLAFVTFFTVFIYYDVLVLYALISAIRGKGIWTLSVEQAAARPMSGIAVDLNAGGMVMGHQHQQPYPMAYPGDGAPKQYGAHMPSQPGYAYPGAPQQPAYAGAQPYGNPGTPPQASYPSPSPPHGQPGHPGTGPMQSSAYPPPPPGAGGYSPPPGVGQQQPQQLPFGTPPPTSQQQMSAYPPPGVYSTPAGPGQQPPYGGTPPQPMPNPYYSPPEAYEVASGAGHAPSGEYARYGM